MREIAIIGATASGKSALALELAIKFDAHILSLDSLSLYKEIDIASAKPTKEELEIIRHFGINEIYPNEHFSAALFGELYKRAKEQAQSNGKHLIIVGGSSFYLKSLLDGLSVEPKYSNATRDRVKKEMVDLASAYRILELADPAFATKISLNDTYRIEKGLLIYFESGLPPSAYFEKHKKNGLQSEIPIFEIASERSALRERIALRTKKMLESGLIDEVCGLEKKYTRAPKCMGAIGIIEVLEYLDGKIKKNELENLISTHTSQLAKRQETFNKTQFEGVVRGSADEIRAQLEALF